MPHVDLEERRKCKRASKARAKRREEYRSVAPAFNIVERKRKPIVHQYNLYPPPISLAPVNILTLEQIEAKYGPVNERKKA